jgi:hypothetical protein
MNIVPAACEATVAATGGLIAWAVYREISGRYDGLVIIFLAVIGPTRHIMDGPGGGVIGAAIVVPVQILFAAIVAKFVRAPVMTTDQTAPRE